MKKIFVALLLASATQAVFASNYGVSPVNFTLPPDQKSDTVVIKNHDSHEIRLQIEVLAWDVDKDGQNILSKQNNIKAGPGLVTIKPGAFQKVRIVRLTPPSASEEQYRVVVSELPYASKAQKENEVAVRILPMYTLPLFYRPSIALPQVKVKATGDGDLTLINTGNATAQIAKLKVNGKEVNSGLVGYVLPNRTITLKNVKCLGTCQVSAWVNGVDSAL